MDYLALFKELNVRLNRRSLLCVFTDFLDEEQANTMVAPLHRLARRHVPAVPVGEGHRAAEAAAHAAPRPRGGLPARGGLELLADREVLKARVSRGGVQMLDVAPDELSLAAVNRYLDIKARGVL